MSSNISLGSPKFVTISPQEVPVAAQMSPKSSQGLPKAAEERCRIAPMTFQELLSIDEAHILRNPKTGTIIRACSFANESDQDTDADIDAPEPSMMIEPTPMSQRVQASASTRQVVSDIAAIASVQTQLGRFFTAAQS